MALWMEAEMWFARGERGMNLKQDLRVLILNEDLRYREGLVSKITALLQHRSSFDLVLRISSTVIAHVQQCVAANNATDAHLVRVVRFKNRSIGI